MIYVYLKKYSNILSVALLALSFLAIAIILYDNKQLYLKKFDPVFYENKYNHSQWMQSQNISPIRVLDLWAQSHKINGWGLYVDQYKEHINVEKMKIDILTEFKNNSISDEDLYAYAGYLYSTGYNPILINPEVPPLGKYLLGFSINLFHNQYIVTVLLCISSLFLIFFITRNITKSFFASSLAVYLTATNTLFTDQMISTQLDLFQIFFLLAIMYTLMKYSEKHSRFLIILTGVLLGLFLSIKVFLLSFFVINVWLFVFFIVKKVRFTKIALYLTTLNFIGLSIFTLSYSKYFILGHTFREFLGVQKWIYLFYQQSHINMMKLVGNYLWLILFNRWTFWSDGYPVVQYEHWSFMWPIIFIVGIYACYKIIRQKPDLKSWLLITFIAVYNVFLLVVPVFPRYLLVLFIPLNIVISIYFAKILKYER